MAVIKPISGHTSATFLRNYLVNGARALALDFLNMDTPKIEKPDAFDWAAQMDATRAAYSNDTPWRGKRVHTYKHYAISPDPKDHANLPTLRSPTLSWAQKHFSDFEVAIISHDDNKRGIPHAHIVVNNTDLNTGRRLQDPNPKALNRSLQQPAAERNLHHFSDDRRVVGVAARAYRGKQRHRSKTLQREHVSRAEDELIERGFIPGQKAYEIE